MISLNDLEKRLREEFKDPRIHFAVNCASRSCPPIRAEPYVAATLDAQLDDATRNYLASPDAVEVIDRRRQDDDRHGQDLRLVRRRLQGLGRPLAFIQKYGPPAAADAIAGGKAKLEFADYDWSLNSAK